MNPIAASDKKVVGVVQRKFSDNPQPCSNLRGKKFLLGVGAQRCGTTWLDQYLRRHPNVKLPAIKELHYFDQLLRPELSTYWAKKFEERLDAELMSAVGKMLTESDLALLRCMVDRLKMNYNPRTYLNFFDRLVVDGTQVVGEITPSYCLLRADAFKKIREMLVRNGLKPRIVFLMRDPAQRFWSQVRFQQLDSETLDTSFRAALSNQHYLERTRYDLTIVSLKSAFPADELYFDFYENLFDEAAVRRICNFLGLSPEYPVILDRINDSPAAELGLERLAVLRNTFAQVYHFCEAEFGDSLPPIWRSQ